MPDGSSATSSPSAPYSPLRPELERELERVLRAVAEETPERPLAVCARVLLDISLADTAQAEVDAEEDRHGPLAAVLVGDVAVPPPSLRSMARRWERAEPGWQGLAEPALGSQGEDVARYPHWLPALQPEERAWYAEPYRAEMLRSLYPGVSDTDWSTIEALTQVELQQAAT